MTTNPTPQTTQATTQAQNDLSSLLQSSQREEQRLNELLGLQFPADLSEEESKIWNSFFILMRFMYSEEMMNPKDPLESYIPYFNTLDLDGKREYLSRLTSMAWQKQKDNQIIRRVYLNEKINESQAKSVQDILKALPTNRWLEFINNLFNGNPPQELVNNIQEFISQGNQQAPDIEFTPEEIEVLQQDYLQKVLNQTRRKPLNAGRLSGPGYNQTFSADDISSLINPENPNPPERLPSEETEASSNSQFLPLSPTPPTHQVRTAPINRNPRPLSPNQNQSNPNNLNANRNQSGYPPAPRPAQNPAFPQNRPPVNPQNRPNSNPGFPNRRPPLPVQRPANTTMAPNPLPHKTSSSPYSPAIKGLDSLLNNPPQK